MAAGVTLAEHGHAATADPCWEGVRERLRPVELTLEAGEHLLHNGAAVGAIEERREGGTELAFIDRVPAPHRVALVVFRIADEERSSARVVIEAERAAAGVVLGRREVEEARHAPAEKRQGGRVGEGG